MRRRKVMLFDNVFRTMVEKTPELIVMLINEVFGTDYRPEESVLQARNEHETKTGEIITDSVFIIRGITYHIECQACDDSTMAIRMFEYDFNVALEQAEKSKKGVYRIKFPESCVLYIRKKTIRKKTLDIEVEFPNGQVVTYQSKIVPAQAYSVEDIFEKKLYALLPYYILRYEKRLETIETSDVERNKLLGEYSSIAQRLIDVLENDPDSGYVSIILELIGKIVEELLTKEPLTKKGIGEIMGGKVLSLASDKIAAQNRKKGQSILAQTIQRLKKGESVESIRRSGVDEDTIALALTCK